LSLPVDDVVVVVIIVVANVPNQEIPFLQIINIIIIVAIASYFNAIMFQVLCRCGCTR
jgi:hypothetical protein